MLSRNPFIIANILQIQKFVLKMEPNLFHHRIVKDYELDYHISGARKMNVNGNAFTIRNGSMIFRRPGDEVTSSGDYNTYTLTLDFSKRIQPDKTTYSRDEKSSKIQEHCTNPLIDMIPTHFVPTHTSDYIRIFEHLCVISHQNAVSRENDILLNELFGLLIVDVLHRNESEYLHNNTVVIEACNYIAENYNKPLTLKVLADNFSVSPSHFSRLFKQETNSTPMDYIISVGLNNAQQLLRGTDLKISYIASQCGFNDVSYFSYLFKKRLGVSPIVFRESLNS